MDYYSILNVDSKATQEDIKKAYRTATKKIHPDVSDYSGANEAFKVLKTAYETLADPVKRKEYDKFFFKKNDIEETAIQNNKQVQKTKVKKVSKTKVKKTEKAKNKWAIRMQSENFKTIMLGIFFIAIIAIVPIVMIVKSIEAGQIVKAYGKAFNSEKQELIYLGRPTCGYCQQLEPILLELKDRFDFEYTYVNTDKISDAQLESILADLDIEKGKFGTPYLIFVKDGKKVSESDGYRGEDGLFNFLQTNNFIPSDAKLYLNYIGIDGYKEVMASTTNSILVVAQKSCSYCQKARPIYNEIIEENDIAINYLEYDLLSDADKTVVKTFLDANLGEDWGTPTTLVIKDGKKVDILAGLTTKDAFVKFFKDNSLIK